MITIHLDKDLLNRKSHISRKKIIANNRKINPIPIIDTSHPNEVPAVKGVRQTRRKSRMVIEFRKINKTGLR